MAGLPQVLGGWSDSELICRWCLRGSGRPVWEGGTAWPKVWRRDVTWGNGSSVGTWGALTSQEALDKSFITMAVVMCWFWNISGSWAGKISLLLSFLEGQSVPVLMPVAPCPSPAPASHPISLSLCWTVFISSLPPSTVQRLSLRAGRGGSANTEDFVALPPSPAYTY